MYLFNSFIFEENLTVEHRLALSLLFSCVSFLSKDWVCATILLSVTFLYLFQREIGKGRVFWQIPSPLLHETQVFGCFLLIYNQLMTENSANF